MKLGFIDCTWSLFDLTSLEHASIFKWKNTDKWQGIVGNEFILISSYLGRKSIIINSFILWRIRLGLNNTTTITSTIWEPLQVIILHQHRYRKIFSKSSMTSEQHRPKVSILRLELRDKLPLFEYENQKRISQRPIKTSRRRSLGTKQWLFLSIQRKHFWGLPFLLDLWEK